MGKFLEMIGEQDFIDVSTGEVKADGKLPHKIQDLMSYALEDILEEKSNVYSLLKDKGVEISFNFTIPKGGFSGKVKELIDAYKGDIK